ncbi:Tn3 family transposase [Streptomyces sp. NPDC091376]|uniref:Tn3 family transposase n=1 Tax=Streptomyces sp. NPDC091376 TaxID=3365994 RepID=UPI0038079653
MCDSCHTAWSRHTILITGGVVRRREEAVPGDQIGALGLVLNALVLFNTRYMDAAVKQLRADGFDVRDEDVARLSPFVRHHINVLGRYSFQLPDLPGGLRPLRDKHATDDE